METDKNSIVRSQGTTHSERFLAKLAHKTFLSLWSHPNLSRDQGRRNGHGHGKELCDLLVIFGNDVLIFSDKYIVFDETKDLELAWSRWARHAVFESSKQALGAERWIKSHPEKIYFDKTCQVKFDIPFPSSQKARFHRIVVANGCRKASQIYFGENATGSLAIDTALNMSSQHSLIPFTIGISGYEGKFVHVFDEVSLITVLTELDTAADFIDYLVKRHKFLSGRRRIFTKGEEQLLSYFLLNLNEDEEHDFVLPSEIANVSNLNFLDDFWPDYCENYRDRRKAANCVSYFWDEMIQRFIDDSRAIISTGGEVSKVRSEEILRTLASEPRLRRRNLSNACIEMIAKEPLATFSILTLFSPHFPLVAYLIIRMSIEDSNNLEEGAAIRANALEKYAMVVKYRFPDVERVVAIVFLVSSKNGGYFEEFVVYHVKQWTNELEEKARQLSEELDFLTSQPQVNSRLKEYP